MSSYETQPKAMHVGRLGKATECDAVLSGGTLVISVEDYHFADVYRRVNAPKALACMPSLTADLVDDRGKVFGGMLFSLS